MQNNMQILHLDLKEVAGEYVELRYFLDNPNQHQKRELPLTEIADLIKLTEQDFHFPLDFKREQVLAKALLELMDEPMQEMLSRGLVFELPVPKAALTVVCDSIRNLEGQINRAVALGLLEVSPDASLRVPRILPLKLPSNGESLDGLAAEVLYRLWWEESETSTEEQGLEIHRLALRGKVENIAVEMTLALAEHWLNTSRFREVVQLCKSTLEITENYRVLNRLGRSQEPLGEVSQAQTYFQQALDNCPVEDETEKALIIHNLAYLKANTGDITGAIALYEQSLAIDESIGNLQSKAANLHELGRLKANTGDITGAIALYEQSLAIFESIGDLSGKAITLRELGIVKADTGDITGAIALYKQSLAIDESIGNLQSKAANLHELACLKDKTGDITGAIALYEQSLAIKESIGELPMKAATLHQLGRLKANTGDIAGAIALYEQVLAIDESIGNLQGKAATLHQLGIVKANTGDIAGAIALYEQSLAINESIGNIEGKAMTLQWLGWLAATEQGDFETGLNYLQQSLEILQHIQSPEAENGKKLIARIQQLADSE